MSRRARYIAALLVVLAVGYIATGPYISAYRINAAVERDDATGLTELIDFPKLEKNIHSQIEAAKEKDAKRKKAGFFEELFRGIGKVYQLSIAGGATNPRIFGEYARDRAGKTGALFKHMRLQIESADQVSFFVKEPEGNERRYVFNRYGLSWKLTNIDLRDILDSP